MHENRTVAPTADPRRLRTADGQILTPPADWAFLPPGDAALTRRVKAAGPFWLVREPKGRKTFTRGLWAPSGTIEAIRTDLQTERADPRHARRRAADAARRERAQTEYVAAFVAEVRAFLAFAPVYATLADRLGEAVTRHATPVGSGTVARTKRIPVDRRAESAVIAWMRHQTTEYDRLAIARVRGERRRVRQQLARQTRRLLDTHRRPEAHPVEECALCRALAAG